MKDVLLPATTPPVAIDTVAGADSNAVGLAGARPAGTVAVRTTPPPCLLAAVTMAEKVT